MKLITALMDRLFNRTSEHIEAVKSQKEADEAEHREWFDAWSSLKTNESKPCKN